MEYLRKKIGKALGRSQGQDHGSSGAVEREQLAAMLALLLSDSVALAEMRAALGDAGGALVRRLSDHQVIDEFARQAELLGWLEGTAPQQGSATARGTAAAEPEQPAPEEPALAVEPRRAPATARIRPTNEVKLDPAAEVAAAMLEAEGTRGWLTMSGPFPNYSAFARWAGASSEPKTTPQFGGDDRFNCWESIMLVALQQGALKWQQVHALYASGWVEDYENLTESQEAAMDQWFASFPQRVSQGEPTAYVPGEALPAAGDLVFFGGARHVALATGKLHADGSPEVTTFGIGRKGNEVSVASADQLLAEIPADEGAAVTFARPMWAGQ